MEIISISNNERSIQSLQNLNTSSQELNNCQIDIFADLVISLALIEFLNSLWCHFHRHGRVVLVQNELDQLKYVNFWVIHGVVTTSQRYKEPMNSPEDDLLHWMLCHSATPQAHLKFWWGSIWDCKLGQKPWIGRHNPRLGLCYMGLPYHGWVAR